MAHVFFIHWSVSGYWDSFQPLAIVKSAAVNMNVHLYFQTLVPIPLSSYPVVQFHLLPLWHLTVVAVL